MADDLAQADTPDEATATGLDDAVESTNSGTIDPVAAYNAELEAILNGEAVDATQGGEPDVEETEQAEEVAPDQIEQEEEPANDADDDDAGPRRIRLSSVEDRAVAAIAKAKGISLVEAAKIFEGQNPTQHEAAPVAEVEPAETSADITAQIKALQAEKRLKTSALAFEEAADIDEQIEELRDKRENLKIAEVQMEAEAKAKMQEEVAVTFAETRDKWVKIYPDAASAFDDRLDLTPMAKEILRLDAEWEANKDPLYKHPEKAETLIRTAAYNLKIPMNKSIPAVKKTVTNRPLQPASGNARTSATAPAAKLDDVIDGIGSINDYERLVAKLASA